MRKRTLKRGLTGFWWLTLVFLYLPLAVVVMFSFNAANSAASMTGFSLRWYHQLFANDQIMSAFGNTLVLALASSLIALGDRLSDRVRHVSPPASQAGLVDRADLSADRVAGYRLWHLRDGLFRQAPRVDRLVQARTRDDDHRSRDLSDSVCGADCLLPFRGARPHPCSRRPRTCTRPRSSGWCTSCCRPSNRR